MGLFDKSSSKKTTNNTYTDARVVNDAGGGVIGTGNRITTSVADPRGAEVFKAGTTAAADMFKTSAANSIKAWSHTLDASEGLITKLLDVTSDSAKATQQIGAAAIASFEPTDNKSADALKWALMAGVAVLALTFLRK